MGSEALELADTLIMVRHAYSLDAQIIEVPTHQLVRASSLLRSLDTERTSLQARVAKLEEALRLAEQELCDLYRGIAPQGEFADHSPAVLAIRSALGGDHGK